MCRFYTFPTYIEDATFGISCDAFANMKETLTKHKPMVAQYLDQNYDRVSKILATAMPEATGESPTDNTLSSSLPCTTP
jgi:hypothetical protein